MSNIDKDWLELTIVTSSEAIEAVTGILYNTAVKGVSILDPDDIELKKKHPGDWDYFDEELLKIKDDAIVKGYFKDDENFEDYVKYIKDSIEKLDEFGLDKGKGLVTVNKVNEEDWENNWKKYYKPTKVGDRIVVRPIWEEYNANENELVISLDPGMAFGTGTHETTRMCVKAIEKYVKNDSRVFDIGTGSGILAIAAAKMNASEVIGVDLDPVAVDSARNNLKFNDIDNIKILHGNLMDVVEGKADIVVANIIAEIIMILTEDVKKFIKDGGYFISSGIIKDRKQDVMNKLQECGFEIIEANEDGEWVCIVAQMK